MIAPIRGDFVLQCPSLVEIFDIPDPRPMVRSQTSMTADCRRVCTFTMPMGGAVVNPGEGVVGRVRPPARLLRRARPRGRLKDSLRRRQAMGGRRSNWAGRCRAGHRPVSSCRRRDRLIAPRGRCDGSGLHRARRTARYRGLAADRATGVGPASGGASPRGAARRRQHRAARGAPRRARSRRRSPRRGRAHNRHRS
jgi:hypothetical protein